MTGIILVAGYATRLYPLTLNMPKALLEIGGKPILDSIVDKMCGIDEIDKIYVVTNHKFYPHFMSWLDTKGTTTKPITIVDDGTETEESRRGAIGDIKFVIDSYNINDSLMIIAGDNFFTFDLRDVVDFYHKKDADCLCIKRETDLNFLRQVGVCLLDDDSRIIDMEEKPENPKSEMVAYATYVYKADTIPFLTQYLADGNKKDAPGYFAAWLSTKKPVYGCLINGECYDIGTPEYYKEVKQKFDCKS